MCVKGRKIDFTMSHIVKSLLFFGNFIDLFERERESH